jgi:Plasmid replication region DNA-binding N-term
MPEVTAPSPRFGPPSRGVTAGDVERAADALLRAGNRPTIDKVRQKVGTGSPNTINPLLDSWWKRPGSRLDAGPAAFHRLPTALPRSPLLCPLLARRRTRLPPTRWTSPVSVDSF